MKAIKWFIILCSFFILGYFSFLNTNTLDINFFSVIINLSISELVLVAFIAGVLLSLLSLISYLLQVKLENRNLKNQLKLKIKEVRNLNKASLRGLYDE